MKTTTISKSYSSIKSQGCFINTLLKITVIILSINPAFSCTWFTFKNDKNNWFIGRTMEWPGNLNGKITLVPRNYQLGKIKTKYGFVGMSHNGLFSDGMNEHGLVASALWLDESNYQDASHANFAVTDILPYLLGSAKTVDEASKFISNNSFYTISSPLVKGELRVHFAIMDPSGRAIVVEFIKGKAIIYENKVGVMTNDPSFDKQLNLLSKYTKEKPDEETFMAFDYSPEGRFAKMAIFNRTQPKISSDFDAVNRAWSMVNTVDIPQGTLYWRRVSQLPQLTSDSVVADLKNRIYYFRTYDNYDIRQIDLKTINFKNASYQADSLFTKETYRKYKF